MYRWGTMLSLPILTLIVLAGFLVTATPGRTSTATATATIIVPPELPIIFGKTITLHTASDHADVHCFDAKSDKDVIVTIDSVNLLSISTSVSFVWQSKDGINHTGGGGSGGGGTSAPPPDGPTAETLFFAGGNPVDGLPKESLVISVSNCVWVRRFYPGTTAYRMKAVEVSPQRLDVGQPVMSTSANTTYQLSTVTNGLYLVKTTDQTGASLLSIQAIGDNPDPLASFLGKQLRVGNSKFTVKLQGSHLMASGTAPFQMSIEPLKVEEVSDTPITVMLTDKRPAVLLHVGPVIAPQIRIEASLVSGSGALIDLTYQLTKDQREFASNEIDLSKSAKASITTPNLVKGSAYMLVILPNIDQPDTSRSVTLKIAAETSP